MKKHSTLASNTFDGCFRLTCFIVTKLIIGSVHFDDINPPGGRGELSYINLIDIAVKWCQD